MAFLIGIISRVLLFFAIRSFYVLFHGFYYFLGFFYIQLFVFLATLSLSSSH